MAVDSEPRTRETSPAGECAWCGAEETPLHHDHTGIEKPRRPGGRTPEPASGTAGSGSCRRPAKTHGSIGADTDEPFGECAHVRAVDQPGNREAGTIQPLETFDAGAVKRDLKAVLRPARTGTEEPERVPPTGERVMPAEDRDEPGTGRMRPRAGNHGAHGRTVEGRLGRRRESSGKKQQQRHVQTIPADGQGAAQRAAANAARRTPRAGTDTTDGAGPARKPPRLRRREKTTTRGGFPHVRHPTAPPVRRRGGAKR